jgi:hypothetical protein
LNFRSDRTVKPFDASGSPVDATFDVQSESDGPVLYFESRGPDRNTQYAAGLELLLGRLAILGATIVDAAVASSETSHLSPDERRISPAGYAYVGTNTNTNIESALINCRHPHRPLAVSRSRPSDGQ